MTKTMVLILMLMAGFVGQECVGQPLINVTSEESIAAHRPVLIAHRGGVITPDSPECSLKAITLAKEFGYSMVELDIRESSDGVPVLFHDRTMVEACGIHASVSDFTAEELTRIPYLNSAETIVTLETALQHCARLNLGVMLDLKVDSGHVFYETIANLIRENGLENSVVTFSGNTQFREVISDVAMLTVTSEQMEALTAGDKPDLRKRFWFGLPHRIPDTLVRKLKASGALVLPAINTFRYPEGEDRELAKQDIERLLEAGVDGFQIDSVYQDYVTRD